MVSAATLLERWSEQGRLRAGVTYEDIVGAPGTVVLHQDQGFAIFSTPVDGGIILTGASIQLEHEGVQAITRGSTGFKSHDDIRAGIRKLIAALSSKGDHAEAHDLESRLASADERSLGRLYVEAIFSKH